MIDANTQFMKNCFEDLVGSEHFQYTADEIAARFDQVKNSPASQIAKFYSHLRRLHDDMDAERKVLSKLIEHVSMVALPKAFELEGISSFTTDDGDRVTISQVTSATVPAETKDDAYRWLKDNGFSDIVKETVNAQTLGAVAKDILAGNVEGVHDLPDRLFKVNIMPRASVTRNKKGK